MPTQPRLHVWAGRDHAQTVLAGVCQRGSHQGVTHAMALAGGRHLGVLEVEDAFTERRVHELGFAVGQADDESGVLGIVLNGHGPSM